MPLHDTNISYWVPNYRRLAVALDTHPTQANVLWGSSNVTFGFENADVGMPPGNGPFPVVFLMHGGGFVTGDKNAMYSTDFSGNLPQRFVDAGYVCVNLNYGLSRFTSTNTYGPTGAPSANNPHGSPEYNLTNVAIPYFLDHADEFFIDPTKVAITGGSAGGSYALYLAAEFEGESWLKSVIAFSPGTDYRIDADRNPATETFPQYISRLYVTNIHAFEVVEHMGLDAMANDGPGFGNGTGLNQDVANCAAACALASPVTKVATTTAQTKTHVFCSSNEIIPAAVVAQYVKAASDAGVDYTFDVNGTPETVIVQGGGTLDAYIRTTLGLTYTNFNRTNGDNHADYPGGWERYVAYLEEDFAA